MEKLNPFPATSEITNTDQTSISSVTWKQIDGGKLQHSRRRGKKIVHFKRTNLNDGYSWRKYGQKDILGSQYPRSYYRCNYRNTMDCNATKQVQQEDDDPNLFIVTYHGDHTCRQQELRTSPNGAQEEELHSDMQSAVVFDIVDSISFERYPSEVTTDHLTTKSEQSKTDLPSGILVSRRTSDSDTIFHNSQNKVNQHAAKRLDFAGYTHGMMKDKEALVSLLQSDTGRQHNVAVISIVGDEGAGKTTLARLAYDDPMVCEAFELRAWVCLTRVHNVEDLLTAIIKALTTLSCHTFEELSDLQGIVKEEVTSRKFLLVLDNIWDVKLEILASELFIPLRFGGKGSKILVTAKTGLTLDPTNLWMIQSYKLNDMSGDVCWWIMEECAFYDAFSSDYPDLTEAGQMMVPRCEGKPLCARVIGGILRAKLYDPSKSGYDDVLDNIPWKPENNETNVSLALRLSYGFLPNHLKKCLQYCCFFPKGYLFEKNYLIRLWMAQGYVEPQDYEEEEEIGSEYMDELIFRSFLQRSRNPNFTNQFYEIHDLVYDVLQTIIWKEVTQVKDFKKVHIVSFLSDKSGSSNDFEELRGSQDLQSLLVDRHLLEYSGRKKIQILSPKTHLIDSLIHLKALDLSFSNIKELPNFIGNLKNLSYLGLNNTNIRKLLASVCNLYNLQTLELRDCLYLQNLPEGVSKLVNLRHLDTRKESGCIGTPPGLGRLTRLRTLSSFSVADQEKEWHSSISELKNLVNLTGDLCIGGLSHVTDDKDAKEANLNDKEGLESLTLQWSTNGRQIESDEMDGKLANEVFENLKPHQNLKQLVVRDYSGDQFPAWIGNHTWSKLISVTLDSCRWCKKLPPLGQIISLKHLFIRKMDSVKSVGREFLGYDEVSVCDAFPSLETLKIWEMYNLEEWYGVKDGDFRCIRSVSISRCFKLWSLPCFPKLMELTIYGGIELPILSYLPSLTSLSIEGFHSLNTLILQPGLTSALKLEVKDCRQLSSLLGLRYSKTLREIKLDKCPILDLKSDELPMTLEVVDIHRSCSLLGNWCPSDFHENANFGQAIRRRLVREKQQDYDDPSLTRGKQKKKKERPPALLLQRRGSRKE